MKREKENKKTTNILEKIIFILFSGITLGVIALIAFSLIYQKTYADKIYKGVMISGVDIGGSTKEEADRILREKLKYPTEAAFAFKYEDRIWHAIPEELGMQIQFNATVEKAWNYGRNKGGFENLQDRFYALLYGKNLEPILLFDERVAFNFITSLAGYIDEPLEQPSITLQGSEVIITPGKSGRSVDRLMTMTLLQILGRNLQTAEIDIPVIQLEPTASNLAEQKQILESLLGQDFILYVKENDNNQEVDRISADLLAGWINFQPVVTGNEVTIEMIPKRDSFYNRLVTVSVKLYKKPQNARFMFNDQTGLIEPIAEAVVGQELDIEATLSNITKAIQSGEHEAEVVLTFTQPKVLSTANGADLGITELVQSQYTYFFGSSEERVQNIQASAASFYGLLIEPGETFSMAENIGDIDINNGYAEAPVIVGGETVQGIGGGVCQVSTTLFRAAFNYGLPIVERHQHAYRVFYYERTANGNIDPSLAGLDASVYIPVLDLKFTNDTPYWILMETYVNPAASSIQWKFYSTNVNRYVDWTTSGLTNVTKPDPPLYRENPELAPGEIKQVDWEVDGADVEIIRTVYENGAVHLQDRFITNYEPWQAVFEYGPGTPNMPPEETKEP